MQADADYQMVCAYFKSLNIHFCERWMYESIHNLRSMNFGMSANDLRKSMYEKWLLLNLRDLKVGSLPSNITSVSKTTLNGTYAVQVESMINSARSCYSELKKIENPDMGADITDKSDEETNSKRCLTFHLCDGVQEVQAMEYQFIPNIRLCDTDFLPGFKMIIKGPVVCRKGMLLLKQENVKVYGGSVESLCATNNLVNLLRSTLGLSISNERNNIHQQAAITDINIHSTSQNIQSQDITPNQRGNNISDGSIERDTLFSENDDILLGLTFESGFEDEFLENNFRKNLQNEEKCFDVLEASKTDGHHDFVMQENSKNHILNNEAMSNNKRYSKVEEKLNSLCNKKPKLEMQSQNFASSSSFNNSNEVAPIRPHTFSDAEDVVIIDDDTMFELQHIGNKVGETSGKCTQIKISSYLASCKKPGMEAVGTTSSSSHAKEKALKNVKSFPFVYLKQIEDIVLTKPRTFTVKAIILTLKSKISIKNDEFLLKASISDGSSTIQADFSSETVENIMEYSPCEVKSMMIDKNRNSAIAGRLKGIFLLAQQKLLSMNCLMDIKFFNDDTTPLILGLQEVQLQHVNALKARSC